MQHFSKEEIQKKAYKIWESRLQNTRNSDKRTAQDDWNDATIQCSKKSYWQQFWQWTGIKEKKGWDLMTGLSIPLFIFLGGALLTCNSKRSQTNDINKRR
jgi:methionyl-tRNA formyltransferase